jgi:hypothetical protein
MWLFYYVRNPFLITLIGLLLFSIPSKGQDVENLKFLKNVLFLELGGLGPYYSVNLDHIFKQKENLMYSYRIGISVLPESVSLPIGLNFITGKSKHHAEITIGGNVYVEHPFTVFTDKPDTDKMMFASIGGGYRYQKPSGGFFFTIGVTPLLRLDPPSDDFWNIGTKFYPSGHIGIGFGI